MRARAFISTRHEAGVVELSRQLLTAGYELVAAGAAGRTIAVAGLPVTPVEVATRMQPLLGGRVAPMHHTIHAGIAARRSSEREMAALQRAGIPLVDVVVCQLPQTDADLGPNGAESLALQDTAAVAAVLHAALVRPFDVVTLCDPGDFAQLPDALGDSEQAVATRVQLAANAATHTRAYHRVVARALGADDDVYVAPAAPSVEEAPVAVELGAGSLTLALAPAQMACDVAHWRIYNDTTATIAGAAALRVAHGPPPNARQRLDIDVAVGMLADVPHGAAAVVAANGHLCALACASDSGMRAIFRAIGADPTAAASGLLAFNGRFDATLARALSDFEAAKGLRLIAAEGFDDDVVEALGGSGARTLIEVPADRRGHITADLRPTRFGVLVEPTPPHAVDLMNANIVTETPPPTELLLAAELGFRAARHCNSTCVVLADGFGTIALSAGHAHVSDAVQIAVAKARRANRPCVAVVDHGIALPALLTALIRARVGMLVVPAGTTTTAISSAADLVSLCIVEIGAGWRTLR